MFTHQRFPVSLSLISLDLPVRSAVDTSAPSTYPLSKGAFSLPPAVELPYGAREHPAKGQPAVALGVSPERCSHVPRQSRNSEDTSQMLWLDISPLHKTYPIAPRGGSHSYPSLDTSGTYFLLRSGSVGTDQSTG